jgi:citrate lyase beta subunit
LHLLLITENPEVARYACEHGVDWVMIDLEQIGKLERQGHLDTVMSSHSVQDVAKVRPSVPPGRLVVRTNPVHPGSGEEVEAVLSAGADMLMLPWFHSPDEVHAFCRLVGRRAKVILLVETRRAMENLFECCSVPGVDRVHIGLNDLSIELGRRFMFELLADDTVEKMAKILRAMGMPFGIGGVARLGEGVLPAERILAEHARLGSDAAILSRTFHRRAATVAELINAVDLEKETRGLRDEYDRCTRLSDSEIIENKKIIENIVKSILN